MSILMLCLAIFSALFIICWKWFYLNFFSKAKLNRILNKKIFNIKITEFLKYVVLILVIAIYFFIRWTPALINVIKYNLFVAPPSEFRSANISILLLLDLCSFIGILLPFAFLFDKKKKIVPSIAVLSVLGGFATMFFTIPEMYSRPFDAKLFFIGNLNIGDGSHDEPLMFIMHYWMICVGLNIIVWQDKITFIDIIKIIGIILLYLGLILGVSRGFNIQTHVTALVEGDFVKLDDSYYLGDKYYTAPSYEVFCDIFNTSNWELAALSAWSSFTWITLLIAGFKNIFWLINHDKSILIDEMNLIDKNK